MTLTSGADSAYLYDLLRRARPRARVPPPRRLGHRGQAGRRRRRAGRRRPPRPPRRPPPPTRPPPWCAPRAALVAMMMREPAFERDDDSRLLARHGPRRARRRSRSRRCASRSASRCWCSRSCAWGSTCTRRTSTPPGSTSPGSARCWRCCRSSAPSARSASSGCAACSASRRLVWAMPLALAVSYGVLGRWFAVWGIALLAVQALVNGIYSPFSKELLNREIADSGQRATVLSRRVDGAPARLRRVRADRRPARSTPTACARRSTCAPAPASSARALLVASGLRRRRRGLDGFAGEITPTPVPLPADTPQPISASFHN